MPHHEPHKRPPAKRHIPWMEGYRSWKYGTLLASLVSLFTIQPFLDDPVVGIRALDLVFGTTLLFAAAAAARTRRALLVAGVLGVPNLVLMVLEHQPGEPDGQLKLAFQITFLFFALVMVLSDVFGQNRVTVDKLFGSMCGYLLLASVWGIAFSLLEGRHPGSFHLLEPESQPLVNELLYFSLITMTTVGYGDLTPATDQARSLASLEAVTGQFYMAVLVASLVAQYLAAARPKSEDLKAGVPEAETFRPPDGA